MGKESRERGRERRRQRGARHLSVVPETPPAELPAVYNLFPISSDTADAVRRDFSLSPQNPAQKIVDTILAEAPIWREHDQSSASSIDTYASAMSGIIQAEQRMITLGALVGFRVLRQEAERRGGVLPVMTKDDLLASSKTEMGGEDAQSNVERFREVAMDIIKGKPTVAVSEIEGLKSAIAESAIRVLHERIDELPIEEPELTSAFEDAGFVQKDVWTRPNRHRDAFLVGFVGVYHRYKIARDIRNLDSDFRE